MARTLIGLAIGADSAIATAYIAEFAPRSRRGQLSIVQRQGLSVEQTVSIFERAPRGHARRLMSGEGVRWQCHSA
jgi:hypothetical protein